MYIEESGNPKENPFENTKDVNPFEKHPTKSESQTVIILQQINSAEQKGSVDTGCIESLVFTCLVNILCFGCMRSFRPRNLCECICRFCL